MPKKSKSILQLYQIYSQTAENTTDRRLKTNGLYITLNTLLIGLISIFAKCDDVTHYANALVFILIGVFGGLLSWLWAINILSYRKLNTAKFKVILEMEKKLPIACYTREWDMLEQGNNSKKYRLLTKVDAKIPFLFGLVFGIIFLIGLIALVIRLF